MDKSSSEASENSSANHRSSLNDVDKGTTIERRVKRATAENTKRENDTEERDTTDDFNHERKDEGVSEGDRDRSASPPPLLGDEIASERRAVDRTAGGNEAPISEQSPSSPSQPPTLLGDQTAMERGAIANDEPTTTTSSGRPPKAESSKSSERDERISSVNNPSLVLLGDANAAEWEAVDKDTSSTAEPNKVYARKD